jgi:hypothetical protein
MYTVLLEQAEGTLFEKLIVASPQRPYPKVEIGFYLGERYIKGTLEFMSLGEKKDATNIFSWRGDWINIEEAGRIDNLREIVKNLSTRLTGNTSEGRSFLGRMSLISNPWENPDLWYFFDEAAANPEKKLVMNINTQDNKNVSDAQVEQMLDLIPEEERERFTTGQRQEGKSVYFSKDSIERAKSELLTLALKEGLARSPSLYTVNENPGMGVYYMRMPCKDGRMYFMVGDPGIGQAPYRNAPCIMVWDVTEAPMISTLVAFYWGNGGGSIMPFLTQFLEWLDFYKPAFAGVDSTATQKNTAEIINLEYINGKEKSVDAISGFDFSGPKRWGYLVSLRLALEATMFAWPDVVRGIAGQLKGYDPYLDNTAASKIAQDCVATLAMFAYAVRTQYGIFQKVKKSEDDTKDVADREIIRGSGERDRTSARGRD